MDPISNKDKLKTNTYSTLQKKTKPLTILVVEGNIVARKVIVRTLNTVDFEVFEAKNSLEAWNYLQTQTADLILLAITLADKGGYELLEDIKSSAKLQHIPVVMLSSGSRGEIKKNTEQVDGYLLKPFKTEDLFKLVNTYRRSKLYSSFPEVTEIETGKKQLNILVVEDSLVVRKVITRTLTATGYKVLTAETGLEALKKLAPTAPDLILLDIILPDTDGYQVLNEIRKNLRFKHTPVIFLSAKDSLLDKIKGKMSEANDYLTKPFKPEELIHIVSKYLD
ncbi:MAG: response regulator [Methyloprofundus sp.]|nr:response regulator [Methyloprofundus sp.]